MNISAWFLGENVEKYVCTLYHRQRQFVSAEISTNAFLMIVALQEERNEIRDIEVLTTHERDTWSRRT